MGKTHERWVQDAHPGIFNTNIALVEVQYFQPDSGVLANPSLGREDSALGAFGLDFDFFFERHRSNPFIPMVGVDNFDIANSAMA